MKTAVSIALFISFAVCTLFISFFIIFEVYRYSLIILPTKELYTMIFTISSVLGFLYLFHLYFLDYILDRKDRFWLNPIFFTFFAVLVWIGIAAVDMARDIYLNIPLVNWSLYLENRLLVIYMATFANIPHYIKYLRDIT